MSAGLVANAGVLACTISAGVLTFLTLKERLSSDSVFQFVGRDLWEKNVQALSQKLSFLFAPVSGPSLALWHSVMLLALGFLALLTQAVSLLLVLPVVAVLPSLYLERKVTKKRELVGEQLPLWLNALANSLRTSAALGDGVEESARLVPAPLSEELDLLIKAVRLGANMDSALRGMKARVKCRSMDTAIATLLVARDTGGDLPEVLEDTAGALREMERLDGVLRTKTAEGKSQGYLMGALPFALCGALHWIDPTWLGQLTRSPVGYLIMVVSGALWIGAVLVARKVLSVDM